MGHPAPYAGRHDAQTNHVVEEIREGGYDLVVFDEIHHLTSSETLRARENGSHWLTHVLDETRCPMILVGYSDFRGILSENGFLGGRLAPTPALRPYTVDDAERFAMFRLVLEEMEEALGIPERSRLSEAATAARILVTCDGRLGLVENYLTQACAVARRRGYNCLRPDVLQQAVEDVRGTWCNLRFNPFEVEDLKGAMSRFGSTYHIPEDAPVKGRAK